MAHCSTDPMQGCFTAGAGSASWAHRNTFQSHPCCPIVTKSFFRYSEVQKIGLWGVVVLPSLCLRPPYPLDDQTHEVHIYDTLSSQSYLVSAHLHHAKSTTWYRLSSQATTLMWDGFSGPGAGLHSIFWMKAGREREERSHRLGTALEWRISVYPFHSHHHVLGTGPAESLPNPICWSHLSLSRDTSKVLT